MTTITNETSTANILVRRDGGIIVVTIHREPVNAMSWAMFDQLRQVFHRISEDETARVAVLRSDINKVFVAGNDITEFVDMTYDSGTDGLARVRTTFNAIYDCPIPVIAAVDGVAVGSGLCIASVCDIRLASHRATFALPEINVGVLGGSKHAMRLATQGGTRLMMYTGRRISAQRAFEMGMVDEIHPSEDLENAVMALAEEIAGKSPVAIRLAKQGLNGIEDMPLKPAYEFECTLTTRSRRGPDASEAARAWLEKRPPAYADHRSSQTPADATTDPGR